jgi:quercetin dioxygenase-like cupin family protein
MGYHVVDPSTVDPFPDREADPRSITEAVGLDRRNGKLGLRTYTADPGEQLPAMYHYHDEQIEAFYVIEGTLHVETPEGEFRVSEGRVFLVEPENPHRAFNPSDADARVRVLAIGAPAVEDHHAYDPEESG